MDDKRYDYEQGYPATVQQRGMITSPYPAHYGYQQMGYAKQTEPQVLTPGGFKPLSRHEREEAMRIAAEANFTLDGYQVVRREFFSHKYDPSLTIRGNSIIFNNSCISRLDQVVFVQVLVNPNTEKLVIRPCNEGDRDAIRWCIAKEDKRKSRQITCGLFTAKLYEMMGWEPLYRYKLQGTKINYQGEQLYVFDLTSTETYLPQSVESDETGTKRKRSVPVYPADWRDSFGIPVQQHTESTQINLLEGYEFMDKKSEPEQLPMEIIDNETGEVIKV